MTTIHPLWLHVCAAMGGFSRSRWGGRRGRHLDDDDIAPVDDVPSNKPNFATEARLKIGAVETISESMQPLSRPKPNGKT